MTKTVFFSDFGKIGF